MKVAQAINDFVLKLFGMTLSELKKEFRDNRIWKKEIRPRIIKSEKEPKYLENKIIFCANCNQKTVLLLYSGKLVCSSCCSDNWMYPINVPIKFNERILDEVKRPSGLNN